jgi:branched-chain amino acid transport system permease protein
MDQPKKTGMDRRTFIKTSGMIGLGVAASSFGVPKLLRAAPPTIKIGSVQPATGPLSVIGLGQRRGNQLAVDYINAQGGIKSMGGAKLELLLGDSESKPEVGRSEADRLIKGGARVMTGPFQSGVAMAISTLCEQRQVPFIMDVAALDKITDKGKKYTFRVFITVSGLLNGAIKYLKMITDMKGVMPKRAVVTNTADAFGKGMSGGFVKFMEKSGLPIEIVDRVQFPLGIHDLSAEVARIKAAKPDILFPVSRPGDGIILTRELYKQRVELMGIYGPGSPGWYEPDVIKDLGKLIYYVMVNVPWINPSSSVYQQANAAFEKAHERYLDTNSSYAYTGVLVIADILERAASTDPEKILAATRQTNFTNHPVVSGPIQFNEKGDNTGALTALIQVQPDGIYGLIALGLSLIFGVMGVINFAHGQMMVMAMYVSYWIFVLLGVDPYLSLVIVAAVIFVLGYLIQATVVNRILDYPEAMQVLPLVSMGLILENFALLLWGPDYRSPQTALGLETLWLGPVMIDVSRLIAFVLAILITILIFIFLKKTNTGKCIRAASDNRTGAILVGINVDRIYNTSFAMGAATTAAAGVLLLPLMPLSPHLGHDFTLTAFIVVILGGMGNLMGALVGGLILGVAESVSTLFLPATLKHAVSFSILIIIMLFRPQGLLGGKK